MASFSLDPADFPTGDWETSYSPAVHSIDVYRVVARGAMVGIVGRDAGGSMFADRYEYRANQLTRSSRAVLTGPISSVPLFMTGGTYDVMALLQNKFRVHAALSTDSTMYCATTLGVGGVRG